MPGVNLDHSDTALLPFVGDEVVQLGKCPTVQAAFVRNVLVLVASAYLGGLPDLGEVFQDKGSTWGSLLDNPPRQYMVTVPVKTRLPVRQLLQVAFGRFASFGLELTADAEVATVKLFPARRPKKLTGRGDRRVIESQINPDNGLIFGNSRLRNRHDNVQPPLALPVAQISHSSRIALILSAVDRNRKGQNDTSSGGRETDRLTCPGKAVRSLIVADRTGGTLRAFDRLELRSGLASCEGLRHLLRIACLVLGFPGKGTLQGFRGFDACLDQHVRIQVGEVCSHLIVRRMVQLHAVLFGVLPPIRTHRIERSGKLPERLFEGLCLFWHGVELYADRSVHTRSIAYTQSFCKYEFVKGRVCFTPELKPGVAAHSFVRCSWSCQGAETSNMADALYCQRIGK